MIIMTGQKGATRLIILSPQHFSFPGEDQLNVNLSAGLQLCPRPGGFVQMLAFTQVNSLTDIKRAGRDKELDKSSEEVIQFPPPIIVIQTTAERAQTAGVQHAGEITFHSVNSAKNSACLLEQNQDMIGLILDSQRLALAQKPNGKS